MIESKKFGILKKAFEADRIYWESESFALGPSGGEIYVVFWGDPAPSRTQLDVFNDIESNFASYNRSAVSFLSPYIGATEDDFSQRYEIESIELYADPEVPSWAFCYSDTRGFAYIMAEFENMTPTHFSVES